MQFKNILKSFAFISASVVAFASADCSDPSKIDSDECKADILIVTTAERNKEQNEGFMSVVESLKKFDVPANQLAIPPQGVDDSEIIRILYRDPAAQNFGRYKTVVFPNGRVSYSNGSQFWESAIRANQWDIFTNYATNTQTNIVFLNEYPSNYTGTELAYETYNSNQRITFHPDAVLVDELATEELNTDQAWHYPAKIMNESELQLYGFNDVKPILYFEPNQDIPEQTVAAVEGYYKGAEFAAFYTSFGQWSSTSSKLNIYWVNWALGDLSHVSDSQYTNEQAIKLSASPKSVKLAMGCVVFSTILVIFTTLL